MFPNKTISAFNAQHLVAKDSLSQIRLVKKDCPLFSMKHYGYKRPLPKHKTYFPFQTQSNIKYKKTKPKIIKQFNNKFNIRRILIRNLTKYNITPNQYKSLIIRNILFDEKTHFVTLFKEFLYMDDDGEFLKRFYFKYEQYPKMKQILTYYFTVYNINELYSINFLSSYNKNVMLRYYFRKFRLTDKINETPLKDNNITNHLQNEFPLLKHTKILSRSMTLSKVNLLPIELNDDNNYNNINNNHQYKVATQTTQENTKIPTNSINHYVTRNNSISLISNEKTIESIIKNLETIPYKAEYTKRILTPTYVLLSTNNAFNKKKQKSTSITKCKKKEQQHKRATLLDQCLVFPKMSNNTNKVNRGKVTPICKKEIEWKKKGLSLSKKNICVTERNILDRNKGVGGNNNLQLFQNLLFYQYKKEVNKNGKGKTVIGSYKSGGNSLSNNRICNTTRNNTINKSGNKEKIKKKKNLKLISSLKKIKK